MKQHDKKKRNDAVVDSDREINAKGGSDNALITDNNEKNLQETIKSNCQSTFFVFKYIFHTIDKKDAGE